MATLLPRSFFFQQFRLIPVGVWGIGFSNLFINLSTVMIFSLSGVYLVDTLGLNKGYVVVWDGVLQAVSYICRLFAGVVSDYIHNRRRLLIVGYGLGVLSRPLMGLGVGLPFYMVGHLMDRVGNGIQAAPRDALVGDIAPVHIKGACYGLRHSLAIVGSCLGPLVALALLNFAKCTYQTVFLFSAIPAFMGLMMIVFMVKEPTPTSLTTKTKRTPIRLSSIIHLPKRYWWVVGLSFTFSLARFGESLLALKGHFMGLGSDNIPLIMLTMNIFTVASAYPLGRLSDRFDRRYLFAFCVVMLITADMVIGLTEGLGCLFIGVGLWGVQMAGTNTLLAAMVADTAPEELRATGFGVFYVTMGVGSLLAGLWSGQVSDYLSLDHTYLCGAAVALMSLFMIPFMVLSKKVSLKNQK